MVNKKTIRLQSLFPKEVPKMKKPHMKRGFLLWVSSLILVAIYALV